MSKSSDTHGKTKEEEEEEKIEEEEKVEEEEEEGDSASHCDEPVEGVESILDRIDEYFTIAVASKRNSGKTVLITQLLKALIKARPGLMVLVMSGTAGLNKDYDFLPKELVIPFNEHILSKIWKRQAGIEQEKRQHVLVVLDDCLATPEAIRSNMVQTVFTKGRHVAISMIVISQIANYLLTPTMKQNSDIILWSKLNRQQIETLWEAITNVDKKSFIRLCEALGGKDYNFLLYDNYSKSTDPLEFLAVIRADAPK